MSPTRQMPERQECHTQAILRAFGNIAHGESHEEDLRETDAG